MKAKEDAMIAAPKTETEAIANEVTASVGNEVGWAGKAVAVSVEGTFNGFKDGHGWSGPTSFEEMCRLRQKIGFGWPYQDSHSCDFLLALASAFRGGWGCVPV